jgi:hypothetical protein
MNDTAKILLGKQSTLPLPLSSLPLPLSSEIVGSISTIDTTKFVASDDREFVLLIRAIHLPRQLMMKLLKSWTEINRLCSFTLKRFLPQVLEQILFSTETLESISRRAAVRRHFPLTDSKAHAQLNMNSCCN